MTDCMCLFHNRRPAGKAQLPLLIGKQTRHPAPGQSRRKGEPQWCPATLGAHDATIDERGNDPVRLPVSGADNARNVTPWKLTVLPAFLTDALGHIPINGIHEATCL